MDTDGSEFVSEVSVTFRLLADRINNDTGAGLSVVITDEDGIKQYYQASRPVDPVTGADASFTDPETGEAYSSSASASRASY